MENTEPVTSVTVAELKEDPIGVYERGKDEMIAVTLNSVVIFYIASGARLAQLAQSAETPEKEGLSLREAAEMVDTSHSKIKRLIDAKELNGYRDDNGDYAIKPDELRALFDSK